MLGSGAIFPVDEASIKVDPFPLPAHWPRLCGLDFGWDHPTATIWMAWDRESDTIYLYDAYRVSEQPVPIHAAAIRGKGAWIPVAWPHDGWQTEKGSGVQLAEHYRMGGVAMLAEHATFAETGNADETQTSRISVEAGLQEMLTRMQTGRWKVFSHLADWFGEFRLYHREDGKIVKKFDDLMSASRYAMMMRRHAIVEPNERGRGRRPPPNWRAARADSACSDAYASQVKVGIGRVEVAREADPFKFKYRCEAVHRNELWWDILGKPDLSNARYLIRRRFMHRDQAALMYPDKAELIRHAACGWQGIDPYLLSLDGGRSTDLAMAWNAERGSSIEEQQWRDAQHRRVCLFEVWYRVWARALVLKSPDGRVVEYDGSNPLHVESVAAGLLMPEFALISRVRLAWFMGPHALADIASPYRHNRFPYVPFWGKREDRTGTPYGLVRGMMYLQDEVNARISKMQWGLAAVRTTRTDGAVLDDDETFRDEIARPDADIVLDPEKMKQGGIFRVERDFELNEQQFKRLVDAREGIKRTGGIYNSFMGQDGQAHSGVAISGLVEQSNQTLADINDNFKTGRSEVGELLLSMIIEDAIGTPDEITIDGEGIRDDRVIRLNVPHVDAQSGIEYLDNDVQRTRLKVALSDTPSTPSFRAQQEAFKSAPPDYQRVMMPYLFALLDVPNRLELIKALRELEQKAANGNSLDAAKVALIDAQARKTIVEAVNTSVEGLFSATQAANQIAQVAGLAPMADQMLKSAGFVDQDAAPIMLQPPIGQGGELAETTHPSFPANPGVGMMRGIDGPSAPMRKSYSVMRTPGIDRCVDKAWQDAIGPDLCRWQLRIKKTDCQVLTYSQTA